MTAQTSLFGDGDCAAVKARPKNYRIPRYRVRVVREETCTIEAEVVASRDDVAGFSRLFLSNRGTESILIFALDTGNRLIGFTEYEGTTNQCAVYPAEIFRFLLNVGAASFVMAHNHPGGNGEFSQADKSITRRLISIGREIGLPLIDHVIVHEAGTESARQRAWWMNQ